MDVQVLNGLLTRPGPSARTYRVDGFTVVEFRGEVDLASVQEIQAHTDAATAQRGARLIVDLSPATFIDCSALRLLCRARRRALDGDGSIDLVCTHPLHLEILRRAGLDGYFPAHPSVSAISADRP
ncbi:STAS domain-containing protein [Streptomyces sp. NPDC051322]|uniref:STAS domain-containing protein n=1 Tax=Streptomyces sp. NPDC051322 TaxID=3154645 RepID=UPI00344C3C27